MSSKFIMGFVTGAYVATQYDFKPYFDHAERKIRDSLAEFKKDADTEAKKTPGVKEDPGSSIKEFFKSKN